MTSGTAYFHLTSTIGNPLSLLVIHFIFKDLLANLQKRQMAITVLKLVTIHIVNQSNINLLPFIIKDILL